MRYMSVCSGVEWIGKRIEKVERALREEGR